MTDEFGKKRLSAYCPFFLSLFELTREIAPLFHIPWQLILCYFDS